MEPAAQQKKEQSGHRAPPGRARRPGASTPKCCLRQMQRGVLGCGAEPLPAAEKGEAEQGQPSKYASGLRSAPHIWATATRSSAPFFASARCGAPQKSAKRKRTMPAASGGSLKYTHSAFSVLYLGPGCGRIKVIRRALRRGMVCLAPAPRKGAGIAPGSAQDNEKSGGIRS